MPQGTVSWFDTTKGFGFVTPDDGSGDVFVHASAVPAGALLDEGVRVEYGVRQGDRGPQATDVQVLGGGPPRAEGVVLGTVAWFDTGKGFGFVSPDDGSPDVFVHASELLGVEVLEEGERVELEVRQGDRGPQGSRVRLVDEREPDEGGVVLTGTVSWYNPDKGFGFLVPDDLFVHSSAVRGMGLEEGQRVEFVLGLGERGPQAEQVRAVSSPRAERPAPRSARGPRPAGPAATVAWFDAGKGFGFLTPDDGSADLFVHIRSVADGRPLAEGDRVAYAVEEGPRGPVAGDVRRFEEE